MMKQDSRRMPGAKFKSKNKVDYFDEPHQSLRRPKNMDHQYEAIRSDKQHPVSSFRGFPNDLQYSPSGQSCHDYNGSLQETLPKNVIQSEYRQSNQPYRSAKMKQSAHAIILENNQRDDRTISHWNYGREAANFNSERFRPPKGANLKADTYYPPHFQDDSEFYHSHKNMPSRKTFDQQRHQFQFKQTGQTKYKEKLGDQYQSHHYGQKRGHCSYLQKNPSESKEYNYSYNESDQLTNTFQVQNDNESHYAKYQPRRCRPSAKRPGRSDRYFGAAPVHYNQQVHSYHGQNRHQIPQRPPRPIQGEKVSDYTNSPRCYEDLKKERQPEKDYYDKTRDSHVIDYSHNDEDSYNYNYPDRNRKKNTVRQLWHRGSPIIASGKIEHQIYDGQEPLRITLPSQSTQANTETVLDESTPQVFENDARFQNFRSSENIDSITQLKQTITGIIYQKQLQEEWVEVNKKSLDQTKLQQKVRMESQKQQIINQRAPSVITTKTCTIGEPVNKHLAKKYRRKQPSLDPDQPLPHPPVWDETSVVQHAFRSPAGLDAEKGFGFSQSCPSGVDVEDDHHDLASPLLLVSDTAPLLASAGKALKHRINNEIALPQNKNDDELCNKVYAKDSDSFEFNEIDHQIQDTLLKRSDSSEDEPVLRASERKQRELSSEITNKMICEIDPTKTDLHALLPKTQGPLMQVETTSTVDSTPEAHGGSEGSPVEASQVIWTVTLPCEAVLFFDSLNNFFMDQGKVIAVNDINECIQVQYEEKDAAVKLMLALSDMQISAKVAKLSTARGCLPTKNNLLDDADAELTLKLLKITPKEKELEVQRSDSEFLKDYNSTKAKQHPQHPGFSQVILPTDGSDDHSIEAPNFEEAYKLMATSKLSSDFSGFMFAPNFSMAGYNATPTISQVAVPPYKNLVEPHVFPDPIMEQSIFSDQATAITGADVTSSEVYQNSSMCVIPQSFEKQKINHFRNSAVPFHPRTNASSSQQISDFQSTQVANQLQFESFSKKNQLEGALVETYEEEEHSDEEQRRLTGPNRQNVVQRMKNPFGNDSSQDVPLPSMILPAGSSTTFVPTAPAGPVPQTRNTSQKQTGQNTDPQFVVNLDRILRCEDPRTTIMIRHIPNKYTQDMLLERINRLHQGRYDFFYLPLDLNNGCNIGYAFINFVDPVYIVPFYEDLNNQSWETFNSEKICQITYGRIQGKRCLVDNVNKQPETRKIKPLILEVTHHSKFIDNFRMELVATRQQLQMKASTSSSRSGNYTTTGKNSNDFRQFSKRQPRTAGQQQSSHGARAYH